MANVIKEGWVQKRSKYLKSWRQRWLVLDQQFLKTFKSAEQLACTMEIPLNQVSTVVKSEQIFRSQFCFIITCDAQKYFFEVEDQTSFREWMEAIIQQTTQFDSMFDMNNKSNMSDIYEKKANVEITVIKSFLNMRKLLKKREEEILQELQALQQSQKFKVMRALEDIQRQKELVDQYNGKVNEILNDDDKGQIAKIQEIRQIPANHLNVSSYCSSFDSETSIQIDENFVPTFIQKNIKVSMTDPNEHMIRRTRITRALKWRYSRNRLDALTFQVSKNINLTGVGICLPHKQGTTITINEFTILEGQYTNSDVRYRHPEPITLHFSPDDSVGKIQLARRLLVKRGTHFTVAFAIDGASSYKCVECLLNMEGPEGVRWDFSKTIFASVHMTNRSDAVCGPISDFYYTLQYNYR